MITANYTDLRRNLKTYLDTVVNDRNILIVHRPKNASVVVISLDEYNAMKKTEYIMSSPVMTERLRKSENNMKMGERTKIQS